MGSSAFLGFDDGFRLVQRAPRRAGVGGHLVARLPVRWWEVPTSVALSRGRGAVEPLACLGGGAFLRLHGLSDRHQLAGQEVLAGGVLVQLAAEGIRGRSGRLDQRGPDHAAPDRPASGRPAYRADALCAPTAEQARLGRAVAGMPFTMRRNAQHEAP